MGSSRNPETTTTILEIKLTIIGNFFISKISLYTLAHGFASLNGLSLSRLSYIG